jgi:hypothetical protein
VARENAAVRAISAEESIRWLADASDVGQTTGFDASGWPASVWLLHALYEAPSRSGELTHDDLRRLELAAGLVEPLVVNDVDLDAVEGMRLTGATLGRTERPVGDWRRLRWEELARRQSVDLRAHDGPPSHHWFAYRSWPSNVLPPGEGSLDREQLAALCSVLAAHSPDGGDGTCIAYYALLATQDWSGGPLAFETTIDDLLTLYDDERIIGSPSNLWPLDRRWFVWTDYDLWGTKVSGDAALIESCLRDAYLEAVEPSF